MSKVSGVSVLVKIGTTIVGGQTGASLARGSDTIEATSKDSEGWVESIAGYKNWSVDCEGFLILGDNGQAALETAYEDGMAVDVEIRIGETGNVNGITYKGKALITDLSNEFPQDDAVTYSLTLEGTGALSRVVGAAA